jgi:HK97 family phage portal protein
MKLFDWILGRRASLDDRSPFGGFWFEPVSMHTSTGQRVGSEQAMRLAAVYACVQLLAKTFAVLPFCLYSAAEDDGTREMVRDHWLYKLLAKRPNDYQNPFEFRQLLMGHLALRGNAYCQIVEGANGTIGSLMPLHPDRMKPEQLPSGDYRYRYKLPNGTDQIFPRGQIWHLRGLSSNGITGLNPIEAQRDTVGLGLAANEYGSRFFANDATPPGWIEHPGQFKDKTARDNFRESFQGSQTGRNRGKTAVLEAGMKYHPLEVKNSDAQYLESRRFSVSEIARIFGVPPHLIGDLDRATFANIEQQSLEFVIYTMTPIVEAWEASIEFALLNDDDEFDAEFDLSRLLRGDQASRSTFYSQMFQIGALSSNEIRVREGMNPVENGDQRFRPVNLSPLDPEAAAEQAAAQQPQGKPGMDDEDDKPPAKRPKNARLEALASAAVERIARKEFAELENCGRHERALTLFYTKHARFLADALGVFDLDAQAYCAQQLAAIAAGEPDFQDKTRARLLALARGE